MSDLIKIEKLNQDPTRYLATHSYTEKEGKLYFKGTTVLNTRQDKLQKKLLEQQGLSQRQIKIKIREMRQELKGKSNV